MRRRSKLVVGGVVIVFVVVMVATIGSTTSKKLRPAELQQGDHQGQRVSVEGRVTDLRDDGGIRFRVVGNSSVSVPVHMDRDQPKPPTLQEGRVVIVKGTYEDGHVDASKVVVRAHNSNGNGGASPPTG